MASDLTREGSMMGASSARQGIDIGSLPPEVLTMIAWAGEDGYEPRALALDYEAAMLGVAAAKAWQGMRKAMSEVNRHWHAVIGPEVGRQIIITTVAQAQSLVAARGLQHSRVVTVIIDTCSFEDEMFHGDLRGQLCAALSATLALCTKVKAISIADPRVYDSEEDLSLPQLLALHALPSTVEHLTVLEFQTAFSAQLAASLVHLAVGFTGSDTLSLLDGLRFDNLTGLQLGFDRLYADRPLSSLLGNAPKLSHLTMHGLALQDFRQLWPETPIGEHTSRSLRHLTVSVIDSCELWFVYHLPALVSLTVTSERGGHLSSIYWLQRALEEDALPDLNHLQLHRFYGPSKSEDLWLRAVCARRAVSLATSSLRQPYVDGTNNPSS